MLHDNYVGVKRKNLGCGHSIHRMFHPRCHDNDNQSCLILLRFFSYSHRLTVLR
nr:MAG TPA: hypothetical protein [Bacteriophage sp.]